MKYKFKKLDLWEELKVAIGDKPVNVIESSDEMIFDFGDYELTVAEEQKLINLMSTKPLLRGKLTKFVGKGKRIDITPRGGE